MKKWIILKNWIFLILMLSLTRASSQNYLEREDNWVNGQMSGMSIDEKIGQLFIVRVNSKGNLQEEKLISEYIKKYNIGGLCFFQGTPKEQVRLVNKFQQQSRIQLFIGMDAEWGLGMRFPKEAVSFPRQMLLGAIKDNKLIYEMGKEIARHCRATGININFAPSIDINLNPKNPVINDRSFGEIPSLVTEKGYMYMKGLEDNGVMACIKHFPGHGDTDIDSHKSLPVIQKPIEDLEKNELYPFRRILSQHVGAVMVGHIHMPAIDDRVNHPSSLSDKVIRGILRDDIGYDGLIITDAMDMKAITQCFPAGIAEAEALLAGNDVILLPSDLAAAFKSIKEYLDKGLISEQRINQSIERILRAKYKLGLNTHNTLSEEGINNALNTKGATAIKQKLSCAAVTLLKNNDNIIPIKDIVNTKIATLSINSNNTTAFQLRADSYISPRHYQLVPGNSSNSYSQMLTTLSLFDVVIIGIHTSGRQNDFTKDLTQETIQFLNALQKKTKVIVTLFGNPYLLEKLAFCSNLIINYDNDPITQDMTMQAIFGVYDFTGTLPVSAGNDFAAGNGIEAASLMRLGYILPEAVGLISDTLASIDNIMQQMISSKAAPGAQILIAKDGKIVLQKAYGKFSDDGYYVSNNSIYDVASLTKILATTISVMKLSDDHKLDINNPVKYYIPGIDTTNKANLKSIDILAHHAGLLPWLGFYKSTLSPPNSKGFNPTYYSTTLKDDYRIPVARGMFLRADYIDTMYQSIWTSKLRNTNDYKYSDLGFYILQKIVQYQAKKPLDVYTDNMFYKPLGLKNTGFNPLQKLPESNIVPTETDNYWRMQTVKGTVHDMGAAMLGGVGGHAGLFSTSHDVAVLMQMLLNKGTYGGTRYLRPETVGLFTSRYLDSTRRGLGFDLKELNSNLSKNVSALAPESVFGHTGFTGCAAWADPDNNMVYIILTNRTYPKRNQIFNNHDYRIKVQDVIYKAFM